MNNSLLDQKFGYQVSSKDILFSGLMGLSGASFAVRHHQLSLLNNSAKWGHRLICLAELVPILGFVMALAEYVFYNCILSGHSEVPWRTSPLSEEKAMAQMQENALRNFAEHKKTNPNLAERITDWDQLDPNPLNFTHHVADAKGPSEQKKGAHFYKEMEKENGILAGVFNGLGGKEVSAFASEKFQEYFPKVLEEENDNVHAAFEKVIHHIHQDVVKNSSWNQMGSTVVVSYIDKEKQRIYTATLGDSQATIYRKVNMGFSVQAIPISIVSNWASDANRLIRAFESRLVQLYYQYVRYNPISRAIGYVKETGSLLRPLVIHKPEITVCKIKRGDKVILANAGLHDFLEEAEIKAIVKGSAQNAVPTDLVKGALGKMNNEQCDNVTALAIDVF